MGYRLDELDPSVGEGVRRIADEQIGKALAALHGTEPAKAIHEVRTRCKKIRALVRLVRPALANYRQENAAFRDIAASIAGARDAKVLQDTYDLLMDEYAEQVERQAMGSIRRRFTLERQAQGEGDVGTMLAETRERLLAAGERVASWEVRGDGWPAVESGLRRTYRQARRAAAQAHSCRDDATFHELRKSIKDHWFHCRLLEGLWPELMNLRRHRAMELAEILGGHHDLAVFAGRLGADPQAFGSSRVVEVAIGLARARQQRLEAEAWPLLERLLAQTPKAFGAHLAVLWAHWREER